MKQAVSSKLLALSQTFKAHSLKLIAFILKLIAVLLAMFCFIFIGLFGWMLKWDKYEFKEENREKFYE